VSRKHRDQRTRWDDFARDNAEYYILTDLDYEQSDLDAFFTSGEREARGILAAVEPFLRGNDAALELGCGVGRLTFPISRHFERVVAVDVSEEMLARLVRNARARGIENVSGRLADDDWGRDAFDLVYSRLVLQHVANGNEIEEYISRAAVALKREGVAYLQFDTRPRTIAYHVRNALPDPLLPRTWRRGIRRIRRDPEAVQTWLASADLDVLAERGAGSVDHVVVACRR
jgi:SAM-dependent methyltransferase